MDRYRKLILLIGLSLIFTLAGCTGRAPQSTAPLTPARTAGVATDWPTNEWPVSSPEAQGLDAKLLTEMLAEIDRQDLPFDSFLVIRNGAIVSETYYGNDGPATLHDQFSITKSVVSTLIGIALDQGLIREVGQSLLELLPQYAVSDPADLHHQMTLEHILTMTSGLDWSETNAEFRALYQSDDWPGFMLALPVAEAPGTKFSYCSGCSHLLVAVLERVVEKGTLQFAQQNLFQPLGITGESWERDADGVPIGGWGLRLTPRDMAKLGYLFLRQGQWAGRQIVSRGWVAVATRQHTSTDGDFGYGYQWWIDPDGKAFAAHGRDGQLIYVRPELDLIVVTTASGVNHNEIYPLIHRYILPAINPEH